MKDIGILIIKPEIIKKEKIVKNYLEELGYEILMTKSYKNWREIAPKLYSEFHPKDINEYLKGYEAYNFGDDFVILVLRHKDGDTIKRLTKDQGHFLEYQKENESIRSKFGLPVKYNKSSPNHIFTYSGIHVAKDEKELNDHIKLLRLKLK